MVIVVRPFISRNHGRVGVSQLRAVVLCVSVCRIRGFGRSRQLPMERDHPARVHGSGHVATVFHDSTGLLPAHHGEWGECGLVHHQSVLDRGHVPHQLDLRRGPASGSRLGRDATKANE